MTVEFTDQPDPDVSLSEIPRNKDQVTRSHLRIAYRYADKYAGRFIHVPGLGSKGKNFSWRHWDGKRWAESLRGETHTALFELIEEAWVEARLDPSLRKDLDGAQSAGGTKGVLEQAGKLATFARAPQDMDNDRHLLNLENGTFDLRSMQLHDHDHGELLTRVARASYHPDAHAPQWLAFLEEVLPDEEVREFIQRYVGVSLFGEVKEHALVILLGAGRNGKGTFYEAISWMLGDYAGQTDPELFMHKEGAHPVGEMDLISRRWVVLSETERGRRMNAAALKRLTGGDTIKARYLYGDWVEFEPSHTPALVTNWMPNISGDDSAAWDRVSVVEFNTYFPPERRDKHLKEKLREEVDGILLWALEGWRDYKDRGWQLDEPDAVRHTTEDQRDQLDYISMFIEEHCTEEPDAKVLQQDLRSAYHSWRIMPDKSMREAPEYSRNDFSRVITQRPGIGKAKLTGNKSYFTGIRLNDQHS